MYESLNVLEGGGGGERREGGEREGREMRSGETGGGEGEELGRRRRHPPGTEGQFSTVTREHREGPRHGGHTLLGDQ